VSFDPTVLSTTANTHRTLRLPATEQKVDLKRAAIYRGTREGWLLKPVQISARARRDSAGVPPDHLPCYLYRIATHSLAGDCTP
jgi:predicted DNA-binding transcriptional regulator AlpA